MSRYEDEEKIIEFNIQEISNFKTIVSNIDDNNIKSTVFRFNLAYLNNIDPFNVDVPELIICDNIEYFKKLKSKGFQIEFFYEENIFSLDKILKDEEFLNRIANEINSYNFTPLEKHIAIYSLIKNFKPYIIENKSQSSYLSRGLYEYLNSGYWVCAGSANLYANLAHRIGLSSTILMILYHSHDKEGKALGHVKNYVNIEDPKYNTNGYFICDTTAFEDFTDEIELHQYYFKGMLMTTRENENETYHSYDKLDCISYETIKDNQNFINFKKMIKKLDPALYKKIENIDPNDNKSIDSLLKYLLHNKINRPYSYLTLVNALMEVKKHIYKNFSTAQFDELKKYYIENSEDLRNDKDCILSLYGNEVYNFTISEIKNRNLFFALEDLIFKRIPQYIDINEELIVLTFKENTLICNRIPDRIDLTLESKYKLEELGFIFKYSIGGDLIRIIFPNIINDNMLLENYILVLQNQLDNFMTIVFNNLSNSNTI